MTHRGEPAKKRRCQEPVGRDGSWHLLWVRTQPRGTTKFSRCADARSNFGLRGEHSEGSIPLLVSGWQVKYAEVCRYNASACGNRCNQDFRSAAHSRQISYARRSPQPCRRSPIVTAPPRAPQPHSAHRPRGKYRCDECSPIPEGRNEFSKGMPLWVSSTSLPSPT
jgi:hypothetical protein